MALPVRSSAWARNVALGVLVIAVVVVAPSRAQELDPNATTSTTSTTTTLVGGPVGIGAPLITAVVDPSAPVLNSTPASSAVSAPSPVSAVEAPTSAVEVPTSAAIQAGSTVVPPGQRPASRDDFGAVDGAVVTLPPGSDVQVGDVTNDDALQEAPPLNVVVPPAPPYAAPASSITLKDALAKLTAAQRKEVEIARVKADAATARVVAAQSALVALSNRGASTKRDIARLDALRDAATLEMRDRALRQYTGESVGYLNLLLSAKDVGTLSRRADFVSQAQRRDAVMVEAYRQNAQALKDKQHEFDLLLAERQKEVDQLQSAQQILSVEFAKVDAQLQSITQGIPIALDGFVFPVQLPASFIDTYGADRMKGTKFYHLHQGVDIFAPAGTPLRATKRGVVTSVGVAPLGGNRLWLTDKDGTAYYYAHLSQFAVGIVDGTVVEAGQILGFVGTTGNAGGTPAHLHFEIHPHGGLPVNPTPILKAVKDSNLNDLVKALNPTLPVLAGSTLVGGAVQSTTTSSRPVKK